MVASETVTLITESAQECFKTLEELWNDVGLEEKERGSACNELLQDVRSALEAKVKDMQEHKAQISLRIRSRHVKLHSVREQLGIHVQDEAYDEANKDLPLLEQQAAIDKALAVVEHAKSVRLESLRSSAYELRMLLNDLGETAKEAFDLITFDEDSRDLTVDRASKIEGEIAQCVQIREERTHELSVLFTNCLGFFNELGEAGLGNPDLDRKIRSASMKPSLKSLSQVSSRLEELQALLDARRSQRAAFETDLRKLSARLGEPIDTLLNNHSGVTEADLKALEEACAKLAQKLHEQTPALIRAKRQELASLWTELHMNPEEAAASFPMYRDTRVCEEVLLAHEAEVGRLQELFESCVPLLKQVERRSEILKEKSEMISQATDPSRLLDRTGNSFRLRQEEERRRNLVTKELPRLSDKLRRQILEWEEKYEQPFVVKGRRYIDIMDEELKREEEAKEEEKLRREREKEENNRKALAARGAQLSMATNSSPVVNRPTRVVTGSAPGTRAVGDSPNPRPASAGARREGRFGTVPARSPATRTPLKGGLTPANMKDKENTGVPVMAPMPTSPTPRQRETDKKPRPLHQSNSDIVDPSPKSAKTEGKMSPGSTSQQSSSKDPSPASDMDPFPDPSPEEETGTPTVTFKQPMLMWGQPASPESAVGNISAIADTNNISTMAFCDEAPTPTAAEVDLYGFVNCSTDSGSNNSSLNISSSDVLGSAGRSTSIMASPSVITRSPGGFGVGRNRLTPERSPGIACFPIVMEEESDEGEVGEIGEGGAHRAGSSLTMKDWDYLADNYYTEEERVEIGRELARELEDRKEEIAIMQRAIQKGTCCVQFKKGECIGSGSFGQVFLGLNEATGELLAIKEVDCSRAGECAIRDLEAEITMLQQLRHPNIVAYYGVQREKHISVLVEYCAGGSIASVISKFGALSESVVRSYTRQILNGLDYLHSHCIVHRDVKCANCLLDADGNVKVADFGASRKMSTINGGAANMSMKGTPSFMAPEVITQGQVGRQSDIWSVGCCVVEMCTAHAPFANQFSNVAALMWHVAKATEPPALPDTLSMDCRDFCALCFKRDQRERPSARRLQRHPFVATWNDIHASRPRAGATPAAKVDSRRSVADRRISALF